MFWDYVVIVGSHVKIHGLYTFHSVFVLFLLHISYCICCLLVDNVSWLVSMSMSMSMCGCILYLLWSSGYSWPQILFIWNPFLEDSPERILGLLTFGTGLTTAFPTLIDISLTLANYCLVPRMINYILSLSLSRLVVIHDLVTSMQASRWLIHCDCILIIPGLNDI